MNINYEQLTIDVLSKYLLEVKQLEKEINLQSKLYDDLEIDSLDTVEIAFSIQEEYGIDIDIDKIMSIEISTVQDIVNFIKTYCDKSN